MTKLAKQYYLNAKGEKKVNCYKEIKITTKNNKIIIAKASNLFVKNQI